MVLHDVPDRADRVVERAAILDAEVLGHRDLDRLDVLPVPDRLEERVREPQVHDVLHRLLPEEVVDPEQPLLGEDRRQAPVQLARRREVGAERLLDDEPLASPTRPARGELLGDLVGTSTAASRGRRRARRVAERRRAAGRTAAPPPHRRRCTAAAPRNSSSAVLVERSSSAAAIASVACCLNSSSETGPASDADHRTREQTLLREVVERGKRAAAREIAGDPEDDERVGGARSRREERVRDGAQHLDAELEVVDRDPLVRRVDELRRELRIHVLRSGSTRTRSCRTPGAGSGCR